MPSVAGWTSNSHDRSGTTLELTKPAGVQPGDLLLIIAGVDSTGEALQPLTGWTFAVHGGITEYNAVTFALLYRVADGTEGESVTLTSAVSDDMWGWYIRVTGADPDTPIDVVQATEERSEPQVTLAGVETTVDGCLAFYAFSFDGGDGDPFSVPSGWTEEDYQETYSGSGAGSGAWGTRLMATAGSTGDVVITAGGTQDGWSGAVWAVRPAPSGTYELQRKPVGGEWETIETLDDPLYDDAPATSGGYYYRVRYAGGPWSGEVYVPYYTGGDYRIEVARASGADPDEGDFTTIAVVGPTETDYTDSPSAGYWTYRVRRWLKDTAFPWSNEWGLNLVLIVDQAVQGVLNLAATARKSVLARKAGALGLAGTVGKRAARVLEAGLSFARATAKSVSVHRAGTLSPTGALGSLRAYVQALSGALHPAGTLGREARKVLAGTLDLAAELAAVIYRFYHQVVGGALEMAGAALRIPRRVLVGVLAASGQVRKDATRRLAAMLGLAGAVRKGLSVYLAGAISWAGSAASRLITVPQAILHHRLVTRVVDLTLTARRLGLTLADRVRSLRLGDDD